MEASLPTTALFTDRYELTMLDTAVRAGYADTPACFEVFTRNLPTGRRYGVVAGISNILEAIATFKFDKDTLAWLEGQNFLCTETLDRLSKYNFSGKIDAYRDGELYFPYSPILTLEAAYGDGIILETIILSILNHSCAIASAASRMHEAANFRPLIEMGSRRTHPNAAVDAARAAYIAGFASTSNLAAGKLYNIPTVGTAAHASILAAPSEREAFDAQIAAQGVATTLLVDTFDTTIGIQTAIAAANHFGAVGPGAIRIDSGDPITQVPVARKLLDSLGAKTTKIVLTGDQDEYSIQRCAALPVDVFGVGTSLVTGSGHPAAGLVYKLVSIQDASGISRNVAKKSIGKISTGGRKVAWREYGSDGFATGEYFTNNQNAPIVTNMRQLQACVFDKGLTDAAGDIEDARIRHALSLAEMCASDLDISPGAPAFIGKQI
jgi:nicotinate phosphoribosyltransferase